VTEAACVQPVSSAQADDYWAGELAPRDEARIEDHVFACAACAATLADGEALARGVRRLVHSGTFHALVTDTVLNRLARDGVRLRTYALGPGDVVPCAVWDGDDVVVTRLRGDLSGVDTVSVVATLANGEELTRSEGLTIRPGQHELINAISAPLVRQMPATTVRWRVTGRRDGADRLLGEYTLTHEGSLQRGSFQDR
jgi:hypothetical protein